MATTPQIILNNLSFHLDQTPVRFSGVNLTFESLKYGIVGRNGVGKTTFLKLILGRLLPDSGTVLSSGHIIYSPQSHTSIDRFATIAEVLEVASILQAIKRINDGSINENDFERVRDQWDIEKRIEDALSAFNLWPMDISQLFHELSGGQKTKVLLAKTLIFKADFILFDEPTNNLDARGRDVLYQYVENSLKGMLIVSHDRALLNRCDRIIEINTKGIDLYGGNYDFYKEQKKIKQQALEQEIQARSEILTKSKQAIQTRMERHQQHESRGRKEKIKQIKGKGSYNKIEIKSKKGRSESTNRRIRLQADRKLTVVNAELSAALAKLEVQEELNINLENTKIPSGKTVIQIENLYFGYDKKESLINDFNLTLVGPNRIAIMGPNGCGKSTLIQLIRGLLSPCRGKISIGVDSIAYLDQTVSFLDSNTSIVENYLRLNPDAKPFDAYFALASFKFRNKEAEKLVSQLSGGERMRAGLAVSLMASHAPKIIILDEPTNHLDLETIEAVEEALNLYQGAILAVSHDDTFLENIGIKHKISL
ncbi:ribosomal protection-like ABC-F family protein [Candidiatus Paracoxiella cheracis]|uniref:ribosomal protection-like ABC-F family protein n=1 Tax=Candidiatus Paracoxiella cheracis TaxID=3405120 RepID=UPI003BF511C6